MIVEDSGKEYRSAETVRRDGLLSTVDVDGSRHTRLMALQEVLRRLPQAAYGALRSRQPQFQWHVDDRRHLGRVYPPGHDLESVANTSSIVVQLAEALERAPWPIVVTVVAHELAHVVLEHAPATNPSAFDQQEIESWNAVRQWGFAAEADVAEFLLRHNSFLIA